MGSGLTITVSRLPGVGMVVARVRERQQTTMMTKTARFRQVGLSVGLAGSALLPLRLRYSTADYWPCVVHMFT